MKRVISVEEGRLVYAGGAARGQVRLSGLGVAPLSGEAARGAAADPAHLGEALRALSDAHRLRGKKVGAILPGAGVTFRELTLPMAANVRELREMVKNEMLYYAEGTEHYTIEYMLLEENKKENKCRVLAFSVPDRYLESCREAFAQAGMTLSGVDLASNCLGKLAGHCYPGLAPSILLCVHPGSVSLLLVEESFCVLAQTVRLSIDSFRQSNTVDIMADEIADHVARVLQFHYARHRNKTVERLLLLCAPDEEKRLLDLLGERVGMPCEAFRMERVSGWESALSPCDCAIAAGGLIRRK